MARETAPTNQWSEKRPFGVTAHALYPAVGDGSMWGWATLPTEAEGAIGTDGGRQLGVDDAATAGGARVRKFGRQLVAFEEE